MSANPKDCPEPKDYLGTFNLSIHPSEYVTVAITPRGSWNHNISRRLRTAPKTTKRRDHEVKKKERNKKKQRIQMQEKVYVKFKQSTPWVVVPVPCHDAHCFLNIAAASSFRQSKSNWPS